MAEQALSGGRREDTREEGAAKLDLLCAPWLTHQHSSGHPAQPHLPTQCSPPQATQPSPISPHNAALHRPTAGHISLTPHWSYSLTPHWSYSSLVLLSYS